MLYQPAPGYRKSFDICRKKCYKVRIVSIENRFNKQLDKME